MAAPRLAVALVLLLLVGGGLAWVAAVAPRGASAADVGTYQVFVVAPDGTVAVQGLVEAPGTPLETLQALGAQRGFTVDVEEQTWIGSGCTAHYVRGIGGMEETASGGWNYYVRRGGGDWTWQAAGAGCYALHRDEQVEWCWVEQDVCRHHAP